MTSRVRALIGKEILEIRRNPATLLPVALVALMSLGLGFTVLFIVPAFSGERLSADADLVRLSRLLGATSDLSIEGQVQLFLASQFLMFFLLIPITGAMALAAHAVVGEKQARTLEPLLATPLTTVELLLAKVLGAAAPTLAISGAGLLIYIVGLNLWAAPGVVGALANGRNMVLMLVVGPSAALVSLQSALLVSSRVNDARTAQQFGVLIILPLTALLVAQFMGSWLSAAAFLLIGVGLFIIWVMLVAVSVLVFDRENILTRWK